MPKRYPNPQRDLHDRTFRVFRALMEAYWSMCGSWVATSDPKLARRMLALRETVLEGVELMMPLPRDGGLLAVVDKSEATNASDHSEAVH
jgi:hypothetical protein